MPTVSVARDDLLAALGKEFTDEEFDHLCFEFGIELDEVTSEKEMARKQDGSAEAGGADRVIYKIEVPANRYDLLCLEGLTIALRVFMGAESMPIYHVAPPPGAEPHRIIVKPSTKVCAPRPEHPTPPCAPAPARPAHRAPAFRAAGPPLRRRRRPAQPAPGPHQVQQLP